jgi:hypothetical protein
MIGRSALTIRLGEAEQTTAHGARPFVRRLFYLDRASRPATRSVGRPRQDGQPGSVRAAQAKYTLG